MMSFFSYANAGCAESIVSVMLSPVLLFSQTQSSSGQPASPKRVGGSEQESGQGTQMTQMTLKDALIR